MPKSQQKPRRIFFSKVQLGQNLRDRGLEQWAKELQKDVMKLPLPG